MARLNWQILLSLEYELWLHHLKGIFLSFQKILKFLTLGPQNSSYGSWKILINKNTIATCRSDLVGVCMINTIQYISLRAHNLCSDCPISKPLDAFNSSQNYLSNDTSFVISPSILTKFIYVDLLKVWGWVVTMEGRRECAGSRAVLTENTHYRR